MQPNEKQLETINFGGGACRVAAGPGSGKTFCLCNRMARLIKEGIPAGRILMISFTKDAACEMAVRVAKLTGIDAEGLQRNIMTFHSLGARILLSSQWALPSPLAKDPIQPGKCRGILRKIASDSDSKYAPARMQISLWKREDVDTKQAEELSDGDYSLQRYSSIYSAYEQKKQEAGFLDFDDLIFLAGRLLRDNEKVWARWEASFDYVMVDEFPDTDKAQMRIVEALAKRTGNIVVVGDASQSIFGWRSADYTIFMNFKDWFPGHKSVLLATNYRSVPFIIDTYKRVIEGAPSLVPGFLEAIKGSREENGAVLDIWSSSNEVEEAERVAEDIKLKAPLDAAIIVRTNKQMCVLEQMLSAAEIEYVIVGGGSFFKRPEVKTALAYLRVLEDPCDNESLKEVILGRSRLTKFLGRAYVDLLAASGASSWLEILPDTGKPWQRAKGQEIYRFFENIERECGKQSVGSQIEAISDQAGLVRELEDEEDLNDVDNSVEENIAELIKAAQSYKSRESFLRYADLVSKRSAKDDAAVKIMTGHRSKGREFSSVYVCGFNDDILPHRKAEDVEEERRIAYVAISRAMNELTLSYYGTPSRFLAPIRRQDNGGEETECKK